jgi:hypothetical protein
MIVEDTVAVDRAGRSTVKSNVTRLARHNYRLWGCEVKPTVGQRCSVRSTRYFVHGTQPLSLILSIVAVAYSLRMFSALNLGQCNRSKALGVMVINSLRVISSESDSKDSALLPHVEQSQESAKNRGSSLVGLTATSPLGVSTAKPLVGFRLEMTSAPLIGPRATPRCAVGLSSSCFWSLRNASVKGSSPRSLEVTRYSELTLALTTVEWHHHHTSFFSKQGKHYPLSPPAFTIYLCSHLFVHFCFVSFHT